MRTLHLMLVRYFLVVFLVAMALFVLVFELMDIFSNLWRYINHGATLADIGSIALLYVPKCLSYSLPIALLFAISYTMGIYYMNNELISVFGCGVSLLSFSTPLIALGMIFSAAGFWFDDAVVIRTFEAKNEATRVVLEQTVSYSNTNVTITARPFLYQATYYNDRQKTLSGLTVLEFSDDGSLVMRLDADLAEWKEDHWVMRNCRIFTMNQDGTLGEEARALYDSPRLDERPAIFRRISEQVDEMTVNEAGDYVESLRRAGLPYQEALSQYHHKFSFALTPLVVVLVASSVGGLFKRNFLFLSLLGSLGIVVGYYVFQMVAMTLARNGYLSPILGAWSGLVVFLAVGLAQFRVART